MYFFGVPCAQAMLFLLYMMYPYSKPDYFLGRNKASWQEYNIDSTKMMLSSNKEESEQSDTVIPAILLKITRLWARAHFATNTCGQNILHAFYSDACFIANLHNLFTWRTDSQSSARRAESISWCRRSRALGSPCLGTQPSLCIHCLLKNFWLEYEKWMLLLLISEDLHDGVSTFCCHTEQDSLMWACGGEIKGVPCSSIAAQWGSGGQWEEVYWGGAL